MYKYGDPFGDIILILRNSINGTDLATSSKPANILPLEPAMWIEFNFTNISVQPGQTYYLIVLGNDYWDRSAHLYWGISSSDVYLNGSSWRYDYPTNKWIQKPDNDYCFKTYGFNNTPPNTPTITGKTNGKAGVEYEYEIYIEDPDGDDVDYCIDFDDGFVPRLRGWYSPSPLTLKHNKSWDYRGTYTVRAKAIDIYGAVSDWGILEVSMPKDKKKIENTDSKLQTNNDKQFVFLSGKCNKYHGSGKWLHIGPIWWINGTFSFDLYKNILFIANGKTQYIDNSVCVTFTNFRGCAPGFLLVLKILIPGTYVRIFGICDNYNIIEL